MDMKKIFSIIVAILNHPGKVMLWLVILLLVSNCIRVFDPGPKHVHKVAAPCRVQTGECDSE